MLGKNQWNKKINGGTSKQKYIHIKSFYFIIISSYLPVAATALERKIRRCQDEERLK